MNADPLTLDALEHGRVQSCSSAERQVRTVLVLTLIVMVLEIGVGWYSGSLALQADGWHMGTHAAALGLSSIAYWFARTRATSTRFSFGTGKVDALAAYTSALALMGAALWMIVEAAQRLLSPRVVYFGEAMLVAIFGLAFNLVSAWLLKHEHSHDHGHSHAHDHDHLHAHDHGHAHHHRSQLGNGDGDRSTADQNAKQASASVRDPNLEAAYLHVLADALTSVLAIIALAAGYFAGWLWLDAAVAVVGAAVIARWGWGLVARSSTCLLDASPCMQTQERLIARLEAQDDVRVLDFHLWEFAPGRQGCMATILTSSPRPAAFYRRLLLQTAKLAHVTVEVHDRQAPARAADIEFKRD